MDYTLNGVIANIIGLINDVIPVLFALALLMFLYGCFRYIVSAGGSGEGGVGARDAIVWGLVALVVIFSLWGILATLCYTLIGSGSCN